MAGEIPPIGSGGGDRGGYKQVGYVPEYLTNVQRNFGRKDSILRSELRAFVKEVREQGGASIETADKIFNYLQRNPDLLVKVFKDPDSKEFMRSLIRFRIDHKAGQADKLQYKKGDSPYLPEKEAEKYLADKAKVEKEIAKYFPSDRLQEVSGTDDSLPVLARAGLSGPLSESQVGYVPPFLRYFHTTDRRLAILVSKLAREIREQGGASIQTVNKVYDYIQHTPGLLVEVFGNKDYPNVNGKKLMQGLIGLRMACQDGKTARLQYVPHKGDSPYLSLEDGRKYLEGKAYAQETFRPTAVAMERIMRPLIAETPPKDDTQTAKATTGAELKGLEQKGEITGNNGKTYIRFKTLGPDGQSVCIDKRLVKDLKSIELVTNPNGTVTLRYEMKGSINKKGEWKSIKSGKDLVIEKTPGFDRGCTAGIWRHGVMIRKR